METTEQEKPKSKRGGPRPGVGQAAQGVRPSVDGEAVARGRCGTCMLRRERHRVHQRGHRGTRPGDGHCKMTANARRTVFIARAFSASAILMYGFMAL